MILFICMSKKKDKAIISGSFDPITKGHEWLILEALKEHEKIVIVIGHNVGKQSFFNLETKAKMISDFIIKNKLEQTVTIANSGNLYLVDFAESVKIDTIIRGIRDSEDQVYENKVMEINKIINPAIQTTLIKCPPEIEIISSSMVKSLVGFLGWERTIRAFVSDSVFCEFQKRLHETLIKDLLAKFFEIDLYDNLKTIRRISLSSQNFQLSKEDEIFNLILDKYSEPHRYYHNLQHISELYNKISLWNLNSTQAKTIVMAIVFHDIVYDPKATDNEEKSNELFLNYFKDLTIAPKVSKLILATKNHSIHPVGEDPILDIFLDLDLSILGTSEFEFKNYEKNVREEYKFVPQDIYELKRAEIMKTLTVPYRTEEAQRNWGLNRTHNLAKYK